MRRPLYLPRIPQSTWLWAEVSSTRSVGEFVFYVIKYFNSCFFSELMSAAFVLSSGRGHWHADVVHPVFGWKEEYPGSRRADPSDSGSDRPGDLHVNVRQLRCCDQSCEGPGATPLYPDCRLGHRGLHVSLLSFVTYTLSTTVQIRSTKKTHFKADKV